jgi:hypothetical protein
MGRTERTGAGACWKGMLDWEQVGVVKRGLSERKPGRGGFGEVQWRQERGSSTDVQTSRVHSSDGERQLREGVA